MLELYHVLAASCALYGLWELGNQGQTREDKNCHAYILGGIGTGKSTMLYNKVVRDTRKEGGVFVSTHGAKELLGYMHPDLVHRVRLIDPARGTGRGINIMHRYTDQLTERYLIADQTTSLFKKLYSSSWGDNIEELIYNACLAILEASERSGEQATVYNVYLFLHSDEYRREVIDKIQAPTVHDVFSLPETKSVLAAARKLRKPISNDLILATLADSQGHNIKEIVESDHILICDLDQGEIGELAARFIAEVIMTKMQIVAMTRAPGVKNQFHNYYDEFQTYANDSIAVQIEENRKRAMPTTLAHQRSGQLTKNLQEAVQLCGSWYLFRLIADDAKRHEAILNERYKAKDLRELPNFVCLVRQLEHGEPKIRRWRTPKPPTKFNCYKAIYEWNQGRPRGEVIAEIFPEPKKAPSATY